MTTRQRKIKRNERAWREADDEDRRKSQARHRRLTGTDPWSPEGWKQRKERTNQRNDKE